MKSFLIAPWLLFSSFSLYAQSTIETTLPVDTETKRVTYTGVVAVKGVTQNELYTRAKLWLGLTFDDAKDVIKVDEKDAGLIVIRGYSDLPIQSSMTGLMPANMELGYTMTLNFKDERYKYTLTNYQLVSGAISSTLEKEISTQLSKPKNKGVIIAKQYAKSVDTFARLLTESVDATLHKPVSGDGW